MTVSRAASLFFMAAGAAATMEAAATRPASVVNLAETIVIKRESRVDRVRVGKKGQRRWNRWMASQTLGSSPLIAVYKHFEGADGSGRYGALTRQEHASTAEQTCPNTVTEHRRSSPDGQTTSRQQCCRANQVAPRAESSTAWNSIGATSTGITARVSLAEKHPSTEGGKQSA